MSLCEQCIIRATCSIADIENMEECNFFFNAELFGFERRIANIKGTVLEYIASCAESDHLGLAKFLARTFYSGLGEEEILRWLQGSYSMALLKGLAVDD